MQVSKIKKAVRAARLQSYYIDACDE